MRKIIKETTQFTIATKRIKYLELFSIAKIWKQPKCPSTNEWIKKIYYSAIKMGGKKNEILPFVITWMNQEGIMLREMSQTRQRKTNTV